MTACFKDRARVHVETADFLVSLKDDKKAEYRGAAVKKAVENGWKQITPAPFTNHLLFEVQNPVSEEEIKLNLEEEEDFMDLSNL